MAKVRRGAPKKYTKKRLKEISRQILEYTDNEDIPSIAGFAFKYNVRKSALYEYYDDLSDALDRLKEKREMQIESLSLYNVLNPAISKMALMNLGWADKKEDDSERDALNKLDNIIGAIRSATKREYDQDNE